MRFMKGMDLSTLSEVERLGGRFFDRGAEKSALEILRDYGADTVRIRLWNDPYSAEGEPYGAGGNDLATSLAIAKRATAAGMGVLLDFHYSDFWTDPGKQFKPKAWEGLSVPELETAVHAFTKETVEAFLSAGVNLTMVQVGNEVTNGLLWPEGRTPEFDNIARLIGAGIRAVREADAERRRGAARAGAQDGGASAALQDSGAPAAGCANKPQADGGIRVMVHLDNGTNKELFRNWFDEFTKRCGDFDVIGLSYYPFWNAGIAELRENMDELAERYGRDMIVVETSMGYTMEDYGKYEQLPPEKRRGCATKPELVEKLDYPMTKQGQADFIRDLMTAIAGVKGGHGKGFVWWEPAWIPVPGSGWATPASLTYIHAEGPCGNEWANQALFDYDGNALPALAVIRDFKS